MALYPRYHANSFLKTRMVGVFATLQDKVTKLRYGKEVAIMVDKLYDLVDRDMFNNEVKMSKFEGSVLCVVNVASK